MGWPWPPLDSSFLLLLISFCCRLLACLCPFSYDASNHDRFPVGDPSKRAFTYFVLTGGRFIGAAAVRLAVLKFLLSMTATKVGSRSGAGGVGGGCSGA